MHLKRDHSIEIITNQPPIVFIRITQTGSAYSLMFLANESKVDLSFSQLRSMKPISPNFQAQPIIGIHSTAFLMKILAF